MKCAVFCCPNNRRNTRGKSFFRLPRDKDLCKRWLANIGRSDYIPSESSNVCEEHFADYHLKQTNNERKRLTYDGIPSHDFKSCKYCYKQWLHKLISKSNKNVHAVAISKAPSSGSPAKTYFLSQDQLSSENNEVKVLDSTGQPLQGLVFTESTNNRFEVTALTRTHVNEKRYITPQSDSAHSSHKFIVCDELGKNPDQTGEALSLKECKDICAQENRSSVIIEIVSPPDSNEPEECYEIHQINISENQCIQVKCNMDEDTDERYIEPLIIVCHM